MFVSPTILGIASIAATRLGLLLPLVLLVACAQLPTDYEKDPSSAIRETSDTRLAQAAQPLVAAHPGESGLYVLADGIEAMAARLQLVQQAEKAIDAQYYYILPDVTGNLLIRYLYDAAERGVRVRILLDDISTKGYELAFAVLSAHSNIEIRLTNPFANRRARGIDGMNDFQRVNHRMHNKSITFDNTVTIVGGRNIGAEYFGASDEFNYHDVDVLAVGQVADEVSTEFDIYWNSAEAVPVTAFVDADDSAESAEKMKQRMAGVMEEPEATPYIDALDSSIADIKMQNNADKLVWVPARVVFDLPYGEFDTNEVAGQEVLVGILVDVIAQAAEEVFIVSPYFVPGDSGVERFRQLRERGVRCVVVTNSLASTDVAAVYGGYKDYRKPLLEMGVELWELMAYPDKPNDEVGASTNRKSLHAKSFSIDRSQLFIGSFNWDPRSIGINTEMGVMIDSAQLAAHFADTVGATLPGSAWKIRLNDEAKIEWVDVADGKEVVYSKEPQTSAWRRFTARISNMDAIEGQL